MNKRHATDERRNFMRIDLEASVSYSVTGIATPQNAVAHNLSTSGIAFSSAHELKPGDIVKVTIPTASTHLPPLIATTKIVRQTVITDKQLCFELAGEFLEIS